MEVRLSEAEKIFIIHGAQEGFRADGRGALDYRPIVVQTGVLFNTNGSARVRLASTDLLIGVKVELLTVDNMVNFRNRIHFTVDCSANATPVFAGKGGDDYAAEIADALDTAYDNDHVLPDLEKLILSPSHAWQIYMDIVILQYGGNIVDAVGIGVKAALYDTEISDVIVRPADEGKVIVDMPDDHTAWKLDVSRLPLFVSVNRLGTAKIVDSTLQEEACSQAVVWFAVTPPTVESFPFEEDDPNIDDCIITFCRQAGGGALDIDSFEEMMKIGVTMSSRLHTALDQRLFEENKDAEGSLLTFLA